eukprot:Lithocolla_globosa_v1_NODE_4859_length_1350_cov_79.130502.p3 type:complete len:100 gc:universal NODE_4859_length_1350_cov_79.130502:142-441(+)
MDALEVWWGWWGDVRRQLHHRGCAQKVVVSRGGLLQHALVGMEHLLWLEVANHVGNVPVGGHDCTLHGRVPGSVLDLLVDSMLQKKERTHGRVRGSRGM